MVIGVLYESDEWSDHKLAREIARAFEGRGAVRSINMMDADAVERALECDLLVSRVFASARFRGHDEAHVRIEELIGRLQESGPRLVNPPRAHAYEVDKLAASRALAQAGVSVPVTYASGSPSCLALEEVVFPAIIKPVCGGRTTHTALVRTADETRVFLEGAPDIPFMVQELIQPKAGFVTRVEVIASEAAFAMKRSVVENGLSAYRFGSTYERYPDCPRALLGDVAHASAALGFFFGSFDVIESERGAFFIDANSVSNVSEDCTETFGRDLLREYADALVQMVQEREGGR